MMEVLSQSLQVKMKLIRIFRHTKILNIAGGEYYHFGLERAVKGIIKENGRKGKKLDHI